MADPKIKYDIEAAVKGEADAEQLAKVLKDVGDVLEGDLQKGALDAAQALDSLASKQRAIDGFTALKRETQDLSGALSSAVGTVDRLGNELQTSAAQTQTMAAAEKSASAAVAAAQSALQSKRDALKLVREETTGAARRSEEYRSSVAGLKDGIKAATTEVKAQQTAYRTAAQASTSAQNAEAALRKEYDLAIGSAARLSSELRNKNLALSSARDSMQGMGLSTTNLAAQEKNLQQAVAQVRAEVATLAPAYQQAASASSQSTQVQAQNQRTLREGMTSISTQLQRIQQIATVALGGSYAMGLAKSVADTADEFKNLQARVLLATGEGEAFRTSWAGVQRVALDTNSALDETGTLFARLAKASQEGGMAAVQAQERALGLTTTINQSIQLSGGAAEAAKAAITQLIQGLQSGVLRGEEFNSVMEQAPRLAQALANGLGLTTGELRKLAEQGALTSETVMKALEGQAGIVAKEFEKLPPTVGRALQNLSTHWTTYVGESDKGLVSSANAAKVIDALAQNLDVVVASLVAAGKAWAAIQIAGLVADFARWATTTLTATKALESNTAASAANTAAQRANATSQAENAAAQAANTAATSANTVARAANAKAWGEIGAFTRAAGAAQDAATAAAGRNTATVVANTAAAARGGLVWRGVAGLFGPWGIAVAALTPEIISLSRALGEQVAKSVGWGKVLEENERKLKLHNESIKEHAAAVARRNALYEEARSRTFDLTKRATGLIAEFDKLTKAGESTADAIAKIGKDFDASSAEGIRAMSGALNKLLADGKITATEFQAAWSKTLDGKDLAKFEVMARNAFAAAGVEAEKLRQQIQKAIESGASEEVVKGLKSRLEATLAAVNTEGERVATMLDVVLREAVRRTGLEFTALQGKMSAASVSALNDVDAIVRGMDRLKEQGVDVGRVLTASLGKAIQTADSQQAIDALRTRVEGLRKALGDTVTNGLLDQIKARAEEVADALDKATPGVNSLREAMQQLGITSDATLKDIAAKSQEAYDTLASSGKASLRELAEGFKKAAEDAIAANKGIAPAWVEAHAAVRGFKIELDAAGNASLVSMKEAERAADRAGRAARTAGDGFREMASQARTATEVLRDMGIQADTVSQKVEQLVKQGQLLAAAFEQRKDNWSADLEKSKFMNRGNTNPQDLVPTFNSVEEAEAWKAAWLEQYARDNSDISKRGQLGSYMKDLTMFEYEAELDALKIRKAMEDARKKAEGEGGGSGGGGGGSGGGGQSVDRIVNVYIGNSQAYSVPTTATGQYNIEALAREVLRVLERQRAALGGGI
jgi:tape measure domain-containing protein